ncbi:MAG: rhodanese-like domain-containing protein [Aggregatilineales bacterium]
MIDITPKELKQRLDAGEAITVIDVREPWELKIARLDFAQHIPMNDILERIGEVPRDVPVAIMCHVGGRSAQVTDYLNSIGYDNVLNLDGGIMGWTVQVDPSLKRY